MSLGLASTDRENRNGQVLGHRTVLFSREPHSRYSPSQALL
jgi:hypothetical protein